MAVILILGVVFVFSGVLLIALGVPLMNRRVPPNAWWGLRVPATFADEEVWYEANAASGRDAVRFGVVLVIAALVLPLVGVSAEAYALIMCVLTLVGVVAIAVRGWTLANRLHRERNR